MSDDDRALLGKIDRRAERAASISDGTPGVVAHDATPPPIMVDEIGRAFDAEPQTPSSRRRPRLTVQELAEQLWPARRALELVAEQNVRVVRLEAELAMMKEHGPGAEEAQAAIAEVKTLRVELIGYDGKGGILGAMRDTVDRDLEDHSTKMKVIECAAAKDSRFIRMVAKGLIVAALGSIGGLGAFIYSAGKSAQRQEDILLHTRTDFNHRAQTLSEDLTELKQEVKLLIKVRIQGTNP